jgi:hypothetical protein
MTDKENPKRWEPNTVYEVGDWVLFSCGVVFEVDYPFVSGNCEPIWRNFGPAKTFEESR